MYKPVFIHMYMYNTEIQVGLQTLGDLQSAKTHGLVTSAYITRHIPIHTEGVNYNVNTLHHLIFADFGVWEI